MPKECVAMEFLVEYNWEVVLIAKVLFAQVRFGQFMTTKVG